MAKFRKKPVVIDAVQFTGDNAAELFALHPDVIGKVAVGMHHGHKVFEIQTLEGEMRGAIGDWLICGVKGEFYPCKPDIFAATYEPVK